MFYACVPLYMVFGFSTLMYAMTRIPKFATGHSVPHLYLTGHSDGGTVTTALALLESTRSGVSGIAVRAAGFRKQDLEQMQCRSPIPVMIMHGAKDTLFPGWGREAAQWWAHCNSGAAPVAGPDPSGCVTYANCASAAPVLYCEGPQSHREWPGLESRIITFLLGQQAGASPPAGAI